MTLKKKTPTKKQLKYIEDYIAGRLKSVDLQPWQDVCKSLAPPNYDNTTRTKWFEENKFRATVGREVVEFVEEMTTTLQEDELLSKIRVSEVKSAVVKGVRRAEQDQDIIKYLLNDVKLATLRTIVGWVDYPERVENDIPMKDRTRRKSRRGRKKEKGKFRPPKVELIEEWEIVSSEALRLTSTISNNYLHPYQNVELEVDFGPNLVVTSVSPFSWLPDENMIRIGYLKASLGVDPFETRFQINLMIREKVKTFTIASKVHFDNCDKGIREVSKTRKDTFELF